MSGGEDDKTEDDVPVPTRISGSDNSQLPLYDPPQINCHEDRILVENARKFRKMSVKQQDRLLGMYRQVMVEQGDRSLADRTLLTARPKREMQSHIRSIFCDNNLAVIRCPCGVDYALAVQVYQKPSDESWFSEGDSSMAEARRRYQSGAADHGFFAPDQQPVEGEISDSDSILDASEEEEEESFTPVFQTTRKRKDLVPRGSIQNLAEPPEKKHRSHKEAEGAAWENEEVEEKEKASRSGPPNVPPPPKVPQPPPVPVGQQLLHALRARQQATSEQLGEAPWKKHRRSYHR